MLYTAKWYLKIQKAIIAIISLFGLKNNLYIMQLLLLIIEYKCILKLIFHWAFSWVITK